MRKVSCFKRILVLALCVVMLVGLLPAISFRPVYAATTSQNNIVARADYLYGITWTAQSTVYGWNYGYTFYAGNTYRIPYGQPINSGAYIGYYVSVDNFVAAANTPGSVFYTSRSTYDSTSSVYYATDCSAFVSWCWGIDRKTTYSIPQVSTYIGMATASNAYSLQLGDCLNSNDVGHVVLVTDLVYSGSTLTSIEITEQTPPQLKRSYYTPSELGSKYGAYYGIYRYSGSVPAAPAGGSSSGGSSSTSGKYYPACSAFATTFYGGMSEIGINCSWELHQRIAAANGITNFSGTAEQNTTLLNLLIAGKLINPDYSGSGDSGGSSSGGSVTSGSNGYERGYAGGMAGTGEYKAFGLDVSSWQGSSLNFNRIKNAGYDYVILRAGTTNGKDTCFETYYTNAKAAGLDVGVYYYSYATSVSAVKADMEDFLSYIKGKTYEYPVYFDYEDASQQALSSSLSQQICLTAMDMLAAEGYLVGMYTGKYFSTQLPINTICAKYELWIAHYLAVGDGSYDGTGDYWKYGPTYASQYGMYQFTDSVWINGYGPYDGDVCYKDYPSIVKKYGFNGYSAEVSDDSYFSKCTFYPSRCQIEVTEATTLRAEPRSASDAVEDAALGTVYKTTGMYSNNGGNMWYQVKSSDGKTGYIYSGRVEYQGTLTDDITIKNYDVPEDHTPGDVFIVDGTISSTYNQLDKVAVYIYEGKTTSGSPVTGGSTSVSGNTFSLANSTVDNATSFGDLTDGVYTYAISANYTNYYASGTKEATAVTGTKILVNHAFAVGDATVEETYFDQCTFYPSRCTFTTNRNTSIFSEPRTAKTGNTSVALEDAPNGTTYTSTGLYVNAGDNIFYQVQTSDGRTGYIYSGYTDFGKKAYDDITLKKYSVPNAHVKGDYFLVTGTIASSYNVLGTAKVTVYSGFGTDGSVVTSGSAKVSNNKYVLDGSAIDHAVDFGSLPTGKYTYVITVTFSSYYAKEPQVLGTASGTRTLKKAYFTVVNKSVDSSKCSHTNSETVLTAATCTATGTSVMSCSTCGLTETVTTDKTSHAYGSYTVTKPATCTEVGSKEKVCADCGKVYTKEIAATGHSYGSASCTESAVCTVCGVSSGKPLGHSYKTTVTKPGCQTDGYTTHTCSTCGDSYKDTYVSATGHSWKDATCSEPMTCTTCGTTAGNALGHSWKNATCTDPKTCTTCGTTSGNTLGHSWKAASCTDPKTCTTCGTTSGNALGHSYKSTVTKPGCLTDGYTTHTCSACGDSYKDNYVTATGHSWKAASCTDPKTCTTCGTTSGNALGHSYKTTVTKPGCLTDGYTTHTCSACGDSYKDNYVTATGHSWKAASCTEAKTCTTCGTTSGNALGHSYKSTVTKPGCLTDGYTTHTCSACGDSYKDNYVNATGHSYEKGICTVCGAADPGYTKPDYLLVGFINGADYGCNDDSANLGIYQFVDGKLSATFTENSYVFIKTSDNASWFMAQSYCDDTSVNLYSTNTGAMEKLFVPGNVEITFTLTENTDGSLTLSYVAEEPEVIQPTITPKYPSLSFEGEIFYNVYFTVSDATSVTEFGLATFDTSMPNGTINNATAVIPGYTYTESTGQYKVRSNGIPAKKLGDTLYFRIYAKLTDGSYIYSGMYDYSAVAYAKDRLTNSSNTNMKALCVAMLNYGAAAQVNFNYKTDSLMNSFLTADQKALVKDYNSSMVKAVGSVSAAKASNFVYNSAGYTQRYPSVTFEGAFAISYYFNATKTPAKGMKLYYWDTYTYTTVDKLTTDNATGVIDMAVNNGTLYKGTVADIAAKEIDSTIYVAGVYEADGVTYCTGVLPYSLGSYCVDRIANGSANMQSFAAATAVYGYYAKVYFNIA